MFQFGVPETFSFRRYLIASVAVIVLTAIVMTLLGSLIALVLRPDPGFEPLQAPNLFLVTMIFVLIGVFVYGIVGWRSSRPWSTFRWVGLIGLILSFIPDISLFFVPTYPGTNLMTVGTLMFLHIIAAAIVIPLLPRWSAEPAS